MYSVRFKNRTSKSWFTASLTENYDLNVTPLHAIQCPGLPFSLTGSRGTISQTLPLHLWGTCAHTHPQVQKKLQLRALWRPFTTARPWLIELTWPNTVNKGMDHTPWAAPPFNTEQSVLNLTQTESLEMMDVRERIAVWEVYVNSWLHRARAWARARGLSTTAKTLWKSIQSVFEGPQRHMSLEDPLHGAGVMIFDFSLEKTVTRRVPPNPVALLLQWGVWCSLMYSSTDSDGKTSIQWNGLGARPTVRPCLELLLWWWIL